MKERPILFSSPMVRAILNGRKTVTRRVIQCHLNGWHIDRLLGDWPLSEPDGFENGIFKYTHQTEVDDARTDEVKCPHGQPGDRLWVRETYTVGALITGRCEGNSYVVFKDGGQKYKDGAYYRPQEKYAPGAFDGIKWKPSIFMPRWASRITLEITDVRVERVQDIDDIEAEREGVHWSDAAIIFEGGSRVRELERTYRGAFACLWDSINSKRGFGWNLNPWVWAITFKRVKGDD